MHVPVKEKAADAAGVTGSGGRADPWGGRRHRPPTRYARKTDEIKRAIRTQQSEREYKIMVIDTLDLYPELRQDFQQRYDEILKYVSSGSATAAEHLTKVDQLQEEVTDAYIKSTGGDYGRIMGDAGRIIVALTAEDHEEDRQAYRGYYSYLAEHFKPLANTKEGRKWFTLSVKHLILTDNIPEDAYRYICAHVNVQMKALEYGKRDKGPLLSQVREKVAEWYGDKWLNVPEEQADVVKEETLDSFYNPFLNSPSGPVTEALMRLFISHGDVKRIKERRKNVNHSQNVKVTAQNKGAKEGAARIVFSNNASEVKIYLSDIDKISGNNKAARKMLTYALIKVNEQAYSSHVLKRNFIQFGISDLVNAGLYQTPQSARVGFKNSADILTSLKISGTLKKGKKEITQNAGEVLFTGWRAGTGDGSCVLFINERISWDFVAAFYTILPRYCFRLPARSFDLLYYIFYQARQHYEDIEKRGYFTISMKAIQERLNLPDENSRNADRDIRLHVA